MIHTKRGLSDIITNVLIILLVLVAIGIIWAFVRPAIQGGAQQISGANDCLTTTVTPVGCVFNGTQNNATVVFQRGTGSGDVRESDLSCPITAELVLQQMKQLFRLRLQQEVES